MSSNNAEALKVTRAPFTNSHLIIDRKAHRPIGHLGLLLKFFSLRGKLFPIIFIGGIALDPAYRGRGIFKYFFKLLLEKYENQASLFFLWSDLDLLYQKFFFFQLGGQISLNAHHSDDFNEAFLLKEKYRKTNLASISNQERHQLQEIYQNFQAKNPQNLFLYRDSVDWQTISSITSSDLFLKQEDGPDKKILSYMIGNKGMDLRGIIFEHGHLPSEVAKHFKLLAKLKCWLPESDRLALTNSSLEKLPPIGPLFCGLARIGSLKKFAALISALSPLSTDLTQTSESPSIRIESLDRLHQMITYLHMGKLKQMDLRQFLFEFFGPDMYRKCHYSQHSIFISGLDSI